MRIERHIIDGVVPGGLVGVQKRLGSRKARLTLAMKEPPNHLPQLPKYDQAKMEGCTRLVLGF